MKVTKKDLINQVAKKIEIRKEDISEACDVVFEKISQALKEEDRVELRGLGSFSTRMRKVPLDPRDNNSNNKERKNYKSVYFRMAKNLEQKLN